MNMGKSTKFLWSCSIVMLNSLPEGSLTMFLAKNMQNLSITLRTDHQVMPQPRKQKDQKNRDTWHFCCTWCLVWYFFLLNMDKYGIATTPISYNHIQIDIIDIYIYIYIYIIIYTYSTMPGHTSLLDIDGPGKSAHLHGPGGHLDVLPTGQPEQPQIGCIRNWWHVDPGISHESLGILIGRTWWKRVETIHIFIHIPRQPGSLSKIGWSLPCSDAWPFLPLMMK